MAHRRPSQNSYTPQMARYPPSMESSPSMYSQDSLPRSEDRGSALYRNTFTDRRASDRHRSNKKLRSSGSHTPSVGSVRGSVDSSAAYYAAAASLYRPPSSQPSKINHGLSRISEDEDRSMHGRGYYRDSRDSSSASAPRGSSSSHRHHCPNPSEYLSNSSYTSSPSVYTPNALFPPVESPALWFPAPPSHYPSFQPPPSTRGLGKDRKDQTGLSQIITGTNYHGYTMATLDQSRSTKGPRDAYPHGGQYVQYYQSATNSVLSSPSAYSMASYPRSEICPVYTPPPVPSMRSATTTTAYSTPQTARTVRYDKFDTHIEFSAPSEMDDNASVRTPSILKKRMPGLFSRLFSRNRSSSLVSKAVVDFPYGHSRKSPATSVRSLPAPRYSSGKSILKKKHKPSSSVASNIGETQSFHSSRTSASTSSRPRKLMFPFSIFTTRKRSNSVSGANLHSFIEENHPKIAKKGPRFSARRSTAVTGWISDEFQIDPHDATMTLRSLQFSEGKASTPYPY